MIYRCFSTCRCAYLSNIKTLTSLELCGGGVGDLGCAHLATLSNLASLNLSQNERITNRGAASLAALTNLKALNLSNTRVNSEALKFLSGLLKLQSLALYGCKDMEDNPTLNVLQRELPSLRCLRLNSASDEDGVIDHIDMEDEDDDDEYIDRGEDEDLDMNYPRELLDQEHFYHDHIESGDNSVLTSQGNTLDFEDADNGEIESVDANHDQQMDYDVEDDSVGDSV